MNVWLPGAEHIKGKHSVGLPLSGGNCLATMHITASPKGSYKGTRDYLVRMGFEPTLILDPTTGERGQFLPGNRGAYALEHPAGTPATNTAGSIHVQVEWVWPDMRQDITKAPHFAEQWADLVAWLDELGVPRDWPFGFHSSAKTLRLWLEGGYRGHVNCPNNSHVDNLPAKTQPAWPLTPADRRRLRSRLHRLRHRIKRIRHKLGRSS